MSDTSLRIWLMFNANQNTSKLTSLRCDNIFNLMILSYQNCLVNYSVHLGFESSHVFVYNEHPTILEANDGHYVTICMQMYTQTEEI